MEILVRRKRGSKVGVSLFRRGNAGGMQDVQVRPAIVIQPRWYLYVVFVFVGNRF